MLLLLKVVDTKRLTITMFDSLHIQEESAAQRIRERVCHLLLSKYKMGNTF